MTFHIQSILVNDEPFVSRCRACLTAQAYIYKDDAQPDIAALANTILKLGTPPTTIIGPGPIPYWSFQAMLASSPGFADTADNGDGTVNSHKIKDADILAAVQNDWPIVAGLFYDSTGKPIP